MMLSGAIILTGSQLPLSMPRSDALIDIGAGFSCSASCFGGDERTRATISVGAYPPRSSGWNEADTGEDDGVETHTPRTCDPFAGEFDALRGIVLEAFGVGNMPRGMDPLAAVTEKVMIYLTSQCESGELHATGSLDSAR